MITISTLQITPRFLNLIAKIDEFKGAWRLLGTLAPDRLSALRHIATIESVGSSTRIEGSTLSDRDIEHLLTGIQVTSFSTRDEQEVVGYAEVMDLVFESWPAITLTEGHVRQLHRTLLAHAAKDEWHRGTYKTTSNSVAAFDERGREIGVIMETATPFDTPRRMAELIDWFNDEVEAQHLHPLLLIGIFTVVFLEIHPFQDGNGRLSRILTTLLLLRSGYTYVPFSSLESVIEQNKETYYRALRQTQVTIRTNSPDWNPWLTFFLHALQQHMERLRIKIERERLLATRLPELSERILVHVREHGRVTIGEMMAITGVSRNTLKQHFRSLVEQRLLVLHGAGRGVWYGLP